MADPKCHLTFDFDPHPEGLALSDVPEGRLPADAMVVFALAYPGEGCTAIGCYTVDGRTNGPLDDESMFTIWRTMAAKLAESKTLRQDRREFVKIVLDELTEPTPAPTRSSNPN